MRGFGGFIRRRGVGTIVSLLSALGAGALAAMKEQRFSQGRMSRESGLSYNTVKKYLKRLETSVRGPAPSTNEASRA